MTHNESLVSESDVCEVSLTACGPTKTLALVGCASSARSTLVTNGLIELNLSYTHGSQLSQHANVIHHLVTQIVFTAA